MVVSLLSGLFAPVARFLDGAAGVEMPINALLPYLNLAFTKPHRGGRS